MRTIIVQRFYKLSHSALDTDCEFLRPKKARRKNCPVPGSNWRPPDINHSRQARSYYETDVITNYTNETRLRLQDESVLTSIPRQLNCSVRHLHDVRLAFRQECFAFLRQWDILRFLAG